jgi:hypothetical protein
MKKLVLVAALVLVAGLAFAQQWHTANQATVKWDSVGDGIVYDVWLVDSKTDPDKTNPAVIGTDVDATTFLITLNVEGRYFAGVQAKRYVDGELVGVSEMSWSDDPLVCLDGNTFGLRYFIPPGQAKKLRVE